MWVKKSQDELAQSRKGARRKERIEAVALWLLFTVVGATFPSYSEMRGFYILPISEIAERVPLTALLTLPAFLFYWFWWGPRGGRKALGVPQVCLRCGSLKSSDGVDACPCGGMFANMDEVKWVEDTGGQQ